MDYELENGLDYTEYDEVVESTISEIDTYAETVLHCLELAENISSFEESVTEEGEAFESAVEFDEDAVSVIFEKVENLADSKQVKEKAKKQEDDIEDLKDVPDVTIKMPDVQSLDKWVTKAIDKTIARFKKDTNKKKFFDFTPVITNIISELNSAAAQFRNPKNNCQSGSSSYILISCPIIPFSFSTFSSVK